MKSIVIGTAGHIDHGKTALVRALTGIDADRLAEEKRRGITIDLGFAHMELPMPGGETLRLGFVDVPGHERFIRNMLAGVGGIDLVLLVIAADESIKPQTREHLDILQLLGVRRGITVLTKSDAVDPETLDVVKLEVEEFLRGTFLDAGKAPIVAVSSLTGARLDDLKKAIVEAAAQLSPRDSQALARLPIDRVFTMKGFGTVVTGTLISGTIGKDDELEVLPIGRRVRVRGVQVHGQAAEAAKAGQRTAINLAGARTEDLGRGMVLAPADVFSPTRRLDVQLQLLSSAPRPLKNRSRVHFHAHTLETVAEVRVHADTQIDRGETRTARLMLSDPVLLLPGDHFIIRQFSPVVTIGGGVIVDASPLDSGRARDRKQPSRRSASMERLPIPDGGNRESILQMRVNHRGRRGLSTREAVAETGWRRDEIADLATALANKKLLLRFEDRLFAAQEFTLAQQSLREAVSSFHKNDPLRPGMAKGELQEEMARSFDTAIELFQATLASLVRSKQLELVGDLVRLPGHGAQLKDDEAESKRKIVDAFSTAGLKVPALHEVLGGLQIDKTRAQKIMTLLLRDKLLIKISDELIFHRSALEDLRRLLVTQKKTASKIDVAKFKELTGVSRKYAIPLLEYLDRERVTRRVGDMREIL
ncbi:MAG TPA: selenocysteine-specific translation elongation factor [Verrucomicrobiae bacterium]|nr:selenocysteine-specific translation elongation factor [Verrucomicrobiae bacterium]